MTRENKLALVIGFGLLLLAGILVSDHLPAQQRVDEDSLVATETQVIPDASILLPRNAPTTTDQTPKSAPVALAQAEPEPKPVKRSEIVIGGPSARRAAAQNAPSPSAEKLRVHIVRKGETLSEISELYFGTRSKWQEIAQLNNISNADRLTVGTRLVLAPESGTSNSSIATRTAPSTTSTPRIASSRTTTVGEGDTLSDIAKRELGSANRWRDLWNANKEILPNPDRVKPGMTLRVPAQASAS